MDKTSKSIPVSVLDLVPVLEGQTSKEALEHMVSLAQHVEKVGFKRFWLSEHHNTPTLASSATSILMSKVLDNTDTIQVGSGGIMLPNHAPLVVAEQFGTLETMYPKRLNLGLGRAPGTDMQTAHALRRTKQETAFAFPQDLTELQSYFKKDDGLSPIKAYPGIGLEIPVFLLGSSTSSAHLAARRGLPYVFAAHFAPQQLEQAIEIYRSEFQPSEYLDEPYVMVCVNVIAAETGKEAERLATSGDMFYLNVVRGTKNPLQPPIESMDGVWNFQEENMVRGMSRFTFKGDKELIKAQLAEFIDKFGIDELMGVSYIYDQEKRKRSYEILKLAMEEL